MLIFLVLGSFEFFYPFVLGNFWGGGGGTIFGSDMSLIYRRKVQECFELQVVRFRWAFRAEGLTV
eukprot:6307161-Amphidinium_carterae.1